MGCEPRAVRDYKTKPALRFKYCVNKMSIVLANLRRSEMQNRDVLVFVHDNPDSKDAMHLRAANEIESIPSDDESGHIKSEDIEGSLDLSANKHIAGDVKKFRMMAQKQASYSVENDMPVNTEENFTMLSGRF